MKLTNGKQIYRKFVCIIIQKKSFAVSFVQPILQNGGYSFESACFWNIEGEHPHTLSF